VREIVRVAQNSHGGDSPESQLVPLFQGFVTALDASAFAVYCQTFARWHQAEQMLADPENGGLTIKTSTGSPMMNPLLRIAISSACDMIRFAAEFGLSPAARSRVSGSLAARLAPSKFDGFWAAKRPPKQVRFGPTPDIDCVAA
jgi:P27 family predicted phage terminase small subunit